MEGLSPLDLALRFGVALAIGLLIGLQRQRVQGEVPDPGKQFAGVRTFALLALLGATGAFLAAEAGSVWLLGLTIVMAGLMILGAYVISNWRGDVGMTSEAAAFAMPLIGALCFMGRIGESAALGVIIMGLLALKPEFRQLAGSLSRDDILATVKFGVITAIILPLVPDRGLGPPPFDVLNPHKIWLMVVLISGLSFIGYFLIKVVGTNRGIGLTGFLGGLVSSTAVTLTFSQKSRDRETLSRAFALAITIAWTTMFARVVVEVAVVNRGLLSYVWIPMAAAGGAGLAYCVYLYLGSRSKEQEDVDLSNPFELGPAFKFGALYALILLVARAAQMYFGEGGIYVSAVLAGLNDVDAITLSMAELSRSGGSVEPQVASRAVTLAAMSNTLVKAGIVFSAGAAALKKVMLPGVVLILVAGLVAAFLL